MKKNNDHKKKLENAYLGGGCFWCLDAVFSRTKGVESVISGYAGGMTVDPSYEQVCGGKTGHAEVVKIAFDPAVITFSDLLHIYFTVHNPTTLNRQGNDLGTQYRSIILYTDNKQKELAETIMEELESEKLYDQPFVTEVKPFKVFYQAEEYLQKYFEKNPEQAYCQIVIASKVAKLRQKFAEFIKLHSTF